MTLWFHPLCASYKRPQSLLEVLGDTHGHIPDRERLEVNAQKSLGHRRLARIDGAERSPSGQASCRYCREPIPLQSWRIRLVYYEEGRFSPGGFIHLACRKPYFETDDVLDQVLHFTADLGDDELQDLKHAFEATSAFGPRELH
jgi:hypothetical protein